MRKRTTKSGGWAAAMAIVVAVVGIQIILVRPSSGSPGVPSDGASPAATYRAGVAAFKAGRWSEALPVFEAAAAGSTGYLRLCATNMLGQIHRLQGHWSEALDAFGSVADQARKITGARGLAWLALHYQAEIRWQQQEWDAAIGVYEQLLSLECDGKDCPSPVAGDSAALLEKLARLYWRTGRYEKAREMLNRWIACKPGGSRSPLMRAALISLQEMPSAAQQQRLAFLYGPLSLPSLSPAGAAVPMGRWPTSIPALPEPPDPARDRIDQLLEDMPTDNGWRPVLLMEKGWMLFEADRLESSASAFAEAARWSSDAKSAWAPAVRDYADLSRAIVLMRQRKFSASLELAQAVVGRHPQGHVQALAGSLVGCLSRQLQEKQVGAKCGVKTLK
jgi:tetratricopeptide (TPR) repeat protein